MDWTWRCRMGNWWPSNGNSGSGLISSRTIAQARQRNVQFIAIYGVERPFNTNKERSGTFEELRYRAKRLAQAADKILALQQAYDKAGRAEALEPKGQARIDILRKDAARTRELLATAPERLNSKGQELKSSVTDPERAKTATSKEVIQGSYAAQAAVDSANQIIHRDQAQRRRAFRHTWA